MIIVGTLLYVMGAVLKMSLFTGWLIGFSPILILAGIGFILYEFTAKEGSKNIFDFFKSDVPSEIKRNGLSCPYCNKKFDVPSRVWLSLKHGFAGICPYCNKKIKLKDISLPSEV